MSKLAVRKHPKLPLPAYRAGHVFFITVATSYKKHPWFSRYWELASEAAELLQTVSRNRSTELFAWCIMPDHCHFVLRDDDVIAFVRQFKGKLTPVARAFDKSRSLWQRSFHDHALRNTESVLEAAGYVWENPVRAGLVEFPEEYSLSGSLTWPQWRSAYTQLATDRA
ncbi:MAG: transposase, partial [Deltaproteobacteria bacterium]|nr:transposase [Deltaproteobacteria bacterium]